MTAAGTHESAVQDRQPPAGCIFHTDRGSQYASETYRRALQEAGLRGSMSSPGTMQSRELHENDLWKLQLTDQETMAILDDEKFATKLAKLREDHATFSRTDIHAEYASAIGSVTEWRFSTGDYFDRLPYEDERQGYAAPKLLKKKYENFDEARWLGKYCVGFAAEQHVITILPEEQGIQPVSANLYKKFDDRLDVWKTRHRWKKTRESSLQGLGRFESLSNAVLYMTAGQGDAFAIYLYTYSPEGVLLHTDAYSQGWSQEVRWVYQFDEKGELREIRTGGVLFWPTK